MRFWLADESYLLAKMGPNCLPRTPAAPPAAFNNNSNGVPSYVAGNVGGAAKGTGTVTSERVLVHSVLSLFVSVW